MKDIYNTNLCLIELCLKMALDKVYENDLHLITAKVNERSIVYKFATYLQEIIKSTEYHEYDVDVEYNRAGYTKKTTPSKPNGIIPDLIIHKRGSDTNNILVLEFKTEWNRNQETDEKKIIELIDKSGNYKYKYGATILICKDKPYIKWIKRDFQPK
jgi:hypothetical protein